MRLVVLTVMLGLCLAFPAVADSKVATQAYSEGDFKTAYREFLTSAKDGDATAQYALGVMYHKGKGIPQNYIKAAEWYARAAEQGHATAQNNLGIMYRRGEGVARDPKEAFTWIWTAAMQGDARAELNLADMFLRGDGVAKDLLQAYAWLEFAVNDLPQSGRKAAVERRDRIVAMLSPEDVQRAERMAKALRSSRN